MTAAITGVGFTLEPAYPIEALASACTGATMCGDSIDVAGVVLSCSVAMVTPLEITLSTSLSLRC